MTEILGKKYKLNNILEVAYINENNQYRILMGRLYDYTSLRIKLDISDDFQSLEFTEEIKKANVKWIRTVDALNEDLLWR